MDNDLISRSKLKKAVLDEHNDTLDGIVKFGIEKALKLIDNAPTVSDRYDEGYAQGYIDGSTGADWKGGAE